MRSTDFGGIIDRGYRMKRAKGGLAQAADRVRSAGRMNDRHLVHMSDNELNLLRRQWGEPSRNPKTGLPAYDWWDDGAELLSSLFGDSAEAASAAGDVSELGSAASTLAPLAETASSASPFADAGGSFIAMNPAETTGVAEGLTPATSAAPGSAASPFSSTDGNWTSLNQASMPSPTAAAAGAGSAGTPAAAATKALAEKAPNWLAANKSWLVPAAGGLMLLSGIAGKNAQKNNQVNGPAFAAANLPASFKQGLVSPIAQRAFHRPAANTDWYTYGSRPSVQFYDNNAPPQLPAFARGGSANRNMIPPSVNGGALASMAGAPGGRQINGPGGGQDDAIPAMLSNKEYVQDASFVSDLGDGDPDTGARKLDKLRDIVAQHKGRKTRVPPKAKPIEQYAKQAGII